MLNLKRHKQFEKFIKYVSLLLNEKPLPLEAKDHLLVGNWKDFREFHRNPPCGRKPCFSKQGGDRTCKFADIEVIYEYETAKNSQTRSQTYRRTETDTP